MDYKRPKRSDFHLAGVWDRSRCRSADEAIYYYEIIHTQTGTKIGGRYTSKRKAWAYLSSVLKTLSAVRQAVESGQYEIIDGKLKRKEVK